MDKRNIVIGLLATITVISVVNAAIITDTRTRFTRLENRIDHIDEEVDEIATGVKRIVARGSAASPTANTNQEKAPRAVIEKTEYDFGKITKQGGIVSATFTLANTGAGVLSVGDIFTSCGCTSASVDVKNISAGGNATVTVKFDPNFHEEPQGRFSRSVYIPTNDSNNTEIELKIFVEIIS